MQQEHRWLEDVGWSGRCELKLRARWAASVTGSSVRVCGAALLLGSQHWAGWAHPENSDASVSLP